MDSNTTREQFFEMLPNQIKEVVEEILCALCILDCSVEFDIDKDMHHYEPTFRFTTGQGRFHLSFKFLSVGVIENVTLCGIVDNNNYKRISSLENNLSPIKVILAVKKFL